MAARVRSAPVAHRLLSRARSWSSAQALSSNKGAKNLLQRNCAAPRLLRPGAIAKRGSRTGSRQCATTTVRIPGDRDPQEHPSSALKVDSLHLEKRAFDVGRAETAGKVRRSPSG